MIAALLLAQATMVAPAGPATAAVSATAWSCRLTDANGRVRELSGTIPLLPNGRDPNRYIFSDMREGTTSIKVGITGEPGGEWLRDYQLSFYAEGGSYVLNLRLRNETEGVAWMTRYDDSLGQLRQPYRYVSAGLCTADFNPKIASAQ